MLSLPIRRRRNNAATDATALAEKIAAHLEKECVHVRTMNVALDAKMGFVLAAMALVMGTTIAAVELMGGSKIVALISIILHVPTLIFLLIGFYPRTKGMVPRFTPRTCAEWKTELKTVHAIFQKKNRWLRWSIWFFIADLVVFLAIMVGLVAS